MDRDLLGPTFQSEPLQSHTTTMHMQTSNSQCMRGSRADFKQSMLVLLCACRRQIVKCTTRVANCCTQTSNRQMHAPARCVLTSHACGTAASWASCQSLGGRVGKRPVLEARRVQKVCTQANLLTPWRELAWNCWACASQSRLMSTAPF